MTFVLRYRPTQNSLATNLCSSAKLLYPQTTSNVVLYKVKFGKSAYRDILQEFLELHEPNA